MKGETTNVDPKFEACIATVEALMKEFDPKISTKLKIRDYLKQYPTAKIMLENDKEKSAKPAKPARPNQKAPTEDIGR